MPRKHIPVTSEARKREIQLSFGGAYQELAARRFTADILTSANKLRSKRESDHKSEFENLFVRRPIN